MANTAKRNWADGKKLDKKYGGYHYLYMSKRWKQKRRRQLVQHPLCSACLQDNIIKAAQVVHHLIDHKGDYVLFFSSPVQSLCKQCHDNIKYGTHIKRGCDVHGKPYRTHAIYIDKNKIMAGGTKI